MPEPHQPAAPIEALEGVDVARPPNVELYRDARGDDVVVFDTPFDESLNLDIKRLPGRRFDWRERLWIVPVRRGLAGQVQRIVDRHRWLRAGARLSAWLERESRFTAYATVLESGGRPRLALYPLGGRVPAALEERSVGHDQWLYLALDQASAELLGELEGVEIDDPARACIDAVAAGLAPAPAVLELGVDEQGERRIELRTLWGLSVAEAFAELPDAVEGELRDGDFTLDAHAERFGVPADPALCDQLDALLRAHPAVETTDEAAQQLERMRAERDRAHAIVALSHAEDADLELPPLGGELRPFQRAGVRYALTQRGTFLADEQGLGKTIQALAAIESDGAYPATVVCPASMKLTWEREARIWLPDRSVAVVHGRSARGWERAGADRADIVVLNYEIVEAQLGRLVGGRARALVFDESHYCKDARRKRTKAAIKLSRAAAPDALRLALTGTPILNRPTELAPQLRLIGRLSDFGSGAQVSRRFSGRLGLERLHWHLRAHCYVRRLKADVLPQLPAKRMASVPVELDNGRDYRLAEEDVIAWLRTQPLELRELESKVAAALRAEQLVKIGYLRKLAAIGKLAAAGDWIEDFIASGESLVVFAHHRDVQRGLCERFPDAAHVLGADDVGARSAAVDAFQRPDGPSLIVCSTQAAGQGITLTRASNVAFLELDWTPARHDQAEDRCHRIGQDSAVTAWYLLAADTVDDTMAEVLERKRAVIGAVTDGRAEDEEQMLGAVVRALREKGEESSGGRAEVRAAA